jgi:exodeoxyribonuclease-3
MARCHAGLRAAYENLFLVDYRARDWEASDRGRRLDHIWVSRALRDGVSEHAILKDARGWPRPSDHVPVIATINF